ncbi:MAG: CAP domain-containing protein [Isosphaeraceae bacterium]
MPRPSFRRSLRFENLESRELLSGGIAAPTNQEQYMLELINQARINPQAAAVRVTSNLTPDILSTLAYYNVDVNATEQAIASTPAQPPLAWNPDLAAAAQAHSQDMATNQFQSHTGSDGSTADQRMRQAGYTNASSTGENAFAYATSVDEAMQAFLIDWGVSDQGHRRNILQPGVPSSNAYQSVGIGIASTTPNSTVGPLVITQDFGSQPNQPAEVVGVAYYDNQNTGMYEIGEGQGGVQIDATSLTTGQTTSTQTWSTGGYQIALSPGQYQITASVNGTVFQTLPVTIGNVNVEQDFVLSNTWDGRSRDQVINSLVPSATTSQPTASVSTPAATTSQPTASVSTPAATTSQPTASVSTPSVNPLPTFSGSWTSWQAQVA